MDKREKILNAAMELIIRQGLQHTPMSHIADRAGVGMGSVYKRFKNKEDIVNGIYVKIKTEEAAMIFVNYDERNSVPDTFNDIYGRMIDYFLSHPLKFNFISQYAFSPVIEKKTQVQAMSRFHRFDEMYARGLEQGLFKDLAPQHLTYFVFGSVCYWLKCASELQIDVDHKMRNQFLKMAWDSIKK
ncbi:TetR/AcrR family transcriptional regulator [Sinomicrobium weinanense]|uniref:TetR/AcrR family transcriptional regulator n=1 Tax=Sinomicrobium weinanense TaxID=2842200 RepID=A0A926JTP8_9FLAO|nr:TetR/AcrR family transcriptional regulator [Sinomicrobium weinanense]MBC9797342.1 TetR/AcrR family transcriptional regulator [Sinomicrobium weinanense]MBU3124522.1 TetR/AcrR family transcriptional regulator [Sinomicrobium weinanense]